MTDEDKIAWKNISNALVFINPVDIELSRSNVDAISQIFQDQFIEVFNAKHDKMMEPLRRMISGFNFMSKPEPVRRHSGCDEESFRMLNNRKLF